MKWLYSRRSLSQLVRSREAGRRSFPGTGLGAERVSKPSCAIAQGSRAGSAGCHQSAVPAGSARPQSCWSLSMQRLMLVLSLLSLRITGNDGWKMDSPSCIGCAWAFCPAGISDTAHPALPHTLLGWSLCRIWPPWSSWVPSTSGCSVILWSR